MWALVTLAMSVRDKSVAPEVGPSLICSGVLLVAWAVIRHYARRAS